LIEMPCEAAGSARCPWRCTRVTVEKHKRDVEQRAIGTNPLLMMVHSCATRILLAEFPEMPISSDLDGVDEPCRYNYCGKKHPVRAPSTCTCKLLVEIHLHNLNGSILVRCNDCPLCLDGFLDHLPRYRWSRLSLLSLHPSTC